MEIGGTASVALDQGRQGQTLRRAGVAAFNGRRQGLFEGKSATNPCGAKVGCYCFGSSRAVSRVWGARLGCELARGGAKLRFACCHGAAVLASVPRCKSARSPGCGLRCIPPEKRFARAFEISKESPPPVLDRMGGEGARRPRGKSARGGQRVSRRGACGRSVAGSWA